MPGKQSSVHGKKIIIIGAGPAGLTVAYQLIKQGVEVEIYEASGSVGGLSKTIELWGQKVDLGPHRFFSNDPVVNKFWLEIIEGDYAIVNRLTRIFYKNKFFNYPLEPFNVLSNLGIAESVRCIFSYIKAKIFVAKNQSTFAGWAVSRFGRRLFEIFFKSYSEKLWGISCAELDADFARQRIKNLSLFEAAKSVFTRNKNKHKSLVDQFKYPLEGTGMFYEKLAHKISQMGGVIFLNSPVRGIMIKNDNEIAVTLNDGSQKTFTHAISTMPLTLLINSMNAPHEIKKAASELNFRNTILVYLEVKGKDHFPDQWIYVHAPLLRTGRITNFRNWTPNICKTSANTILCMEYWCGNDEPIWHEGEDLLIKRAVEEIMSTNLVSENSILNGHVIKIPRSYPVYAVGYKQHLEIVRGYLMNFPNLMPIGRYGSFKYNNQDHSILMGILAAEKILNDKDVNLWEVNMDDVYQEQ